MPMSFRRGAVVLAAALFVPPSLAAAPAADAPAMARTLGEWLAQDLAADRLPPGDARDAAIALLHAAVVDALGAARAAQDARAAAGEPSPTCIPPPGKVEMTSTEVATWLHARKPEEYGESMRNVVARFLAARFPCG
jgi:hypothetical protein